MQGCDMQLVARQW